MMIDDHERIWLDAYNAALTGHVGRTSWPGSAAESDAEDALDRYLKRWNQKGTTMENKSTVASSTALGAKLALTNQAGDIILRVARRLANDNPWITEALKTEDGRDLVKYGLASMLVVLANGGVFPKGNDEIARIAGLQAAASSFILLNRHGAGMLGDLDELIGLGEVLSRDADA